MILYLDTSSLVKLYTLESGSESVRAQARQVTSLATSIVTYAELRATLARLHREGRHTAEEHSTALDNFERDWSDVHPVEVTDSLVRRAGALAEQFALRGFDAIHLSSALTLRTEANEPVSFSAFDGRLRDAAEACGLVVP